MIIETDCDKMNFSSNINEVIRPVLNFLFFFTIRFHKYKKAPKSIKKHNQLKIYQFKIHRHKIYQFKIHQHKIYQFKIDRHKIYSFKIHRHKIYQFKIHQHKTYQV